MMSIKCPFFWTQVLPRKTLTSPPSCCMNIEEKEEEEEGGGGGGKNIEGGGHSVKRLFFCAFHKTESTGIEPGEECSC